MSEAPDPIDDPEGYALWCEMHACRTCEGSGEVFCSDEDEGIDGMRDCYACGGSGIDPASRMPDYDEDDE
ncbi:MAG: hypothetical protein J5J06_05445 [Phycisphaerae bacterium]|nr:hypothetical protein [Phycisphaerae bacterium]